MARRLSPTRCASAPQGGTAPPPQETYTPRIRQEPPTAQDIRPKWVHSRTETGIGKSKSTPAKLKTFRGGKFFRQKLIFFYVELPFLTIRGIFSVINHRLLATIQRQPAAGRAVSTARNRRYTAMPPQTPAAPEDCGDARRRGYGRTPRKVRHFLRIPRQNKNIPRQNIFIPRHCYPGNALICLDCRTLP